MTARCGPFTACVDRDLVRRFAAATRDPSPRVQDGTAVPPVALVTQVWDAQEAGRVAAIPTALQQRGVHGEHDLVVHRPVEPGEALTTWVEPHGARVAGGNSVVTLRYLMHGADGALVAEQWWTTVFLGMTSEPAGDPAPTHAFPEDARDAPVGTYSIEVDLEMARRYAEASGDWSPHHFDAKAARLSGYDRPFLHGVCTMALCAQAVTALVAEGDPDRLRRIAVRFATPTFLGERLDVRVYDAGDGAYAFEADSANARVISNGRAELRERFLINEAQGPATAR